MTQMDTLGLTVETFQWENRPVTELIYSLNGRDLVEILRDIETPYVIRSSVMPLPGVDLNDRALLARYRKQAAIYMGVNLKEFRESRDAFLGNTTAHEWAVLLKCSGCGDIACSSFWVRASRSADFIQWEAYTSGRKGWTYDTMPQYTFDAAQYESEISRILSI
jgi:hypothetical protein